MNESKGKSGCITLIAKVVALGLGIIVSTCFFHDSELNRVSPKNFILSTVVIFLSLCIKSKILIELFVLMHEMSLFPV